MTTAAALTNPTTAPEQRLPRDVLIWLLSVFIVGACTIVYELLVGAISTYFLGDSVKQFALTIGLTMFGMGLGTSLSKMVHKELFTAFLWIELALALVGGLSVPLLYGAFLVMPEQYWAAMALLVLVLGALIGLEIPLLTRLMERHAPLRVNIANVLSLDYLGALATTLLFPFLLLPCVGLFKSAVLTGLLNWLVFAVNFWGLPQTGISRRTRHGLTITSVLVGLLLLGVLTGATPLMRGWERQAYDDRILFSKQTRYQKLVVTRHKDDVRLFIDGNLQFSTIDEYRYHEPLVHLPMALNPKARDVLILGGGDGLAARELLKHPSVRITLVDLDPGMTELFSTHPLLKGFNQGSLTAPKVKVINADAFIWLEANDSVYDFIVIDFPDPTNFSLGKLYTTAFYRLLKHHLSEGGFAVAQSTSPLFARQSFWCVAETMKAAGLQVFPYHAYVPSFGEWGFILAGNHRYEPPDALPSGLRFLTTKIVPQLFEFPADMGPVEAQPNRLNDQILVRYYEREWREVAR